nr:MAG TPA: hypothetical protein [Caudoviricetes sp.]
MPEIDYLGWHRDNMKSMTFLFFQNIHKYLWPVVGSQKIKKK